MKILNPIVKTIAALGIMGALFFSCSMYDGGKDGTLIITLPGSDSARAATSDIRQYRIACGNGTDEVVRYASSGSVSMSLPSGRWAVILTVLDKKNNQDIGSSDPKTAVIEGGKTTAISISIDLDEDPYLGAESLTLSGQVYGGKSNNEDLDLPYRNNAYVREAAKVDELPQQDIKYSEVNNFGQIKSGILRYTIGSVSLSDLLKDNWKEIIDNTATNIKLTSNNNDDISGTEKGLFLLLRARSQGDNYYTLSKKRAYTYQSTTVIESVRYLYVEQGITVEAPGKYTLDLQRGWNAIYTKEEIKNKNKTIEVRLRNPVLRWTLYYASSGRIPNTWPSF